VEEAEMHAVHVEIYEYLASGAGFVAPVLVKRLAGRREQLAEHQTLYSHGRDIEITINGGDPIGIPPNGAALSIRANSAPEDHQLVFQGTLQVEPNGALASCLVLVGEYSDPLEDAHGASRGEALDRDVEESLRGLLGRIKDEVATLVLRASTGVD
jgi:hypothetical protein